MKRLCWLLLLCAAGCGDAPAPAVTGAPSAPAVDEALTSRVGALEKQVAALAAKAAAPRVVPAVALATPPVDLEGLKADAADIVSRLSTLEQRQLAKVLDHVATGEINSFERNLLSEWTSGRCNALIGQGQLARMAASESPGLKWAAANVTPRQAAAIAANQKTLAPILDLAVTGQPLNRVQIQTLEAVIGGHPLMEKYRDQNAPPGLVDRLADALKRSEEIEQGK